jgi:Zn-finger nucleic acid-binding protein
MIVKRVITVEIDVCPSCGGIVLDKGEPEVIEALGVARVIEGTMHLEHDRAAARHALATCYVCTRPMIALTGAGEIEYDWCDSCERVFFDRGELSELEAFQAE